MAQEKKRINVPLSRKPREGGGIEGGGEKRRERYRAAGERQLEEELIEVAGVRMIAWSREFANAAWLGLMVKQACAEECGWWGKRCGCG